MDISLLVRYNFLRKKRLRNKDIAFYASLNRHVDGEKQDQFRLRLRMASEAE
jgi:hypothetical protein